MDVINFRFAKVMSVIMCETCEGKGTPDDPCRIVKTYLTLEGEQLAFYDPAGLIQQKPQQSI